MRQILEAHIKEKAFDHGYLLWGDSDTSRKMAFEAAAVILINSGNLESHPDFLHRRFETLGIDDSRMLKEWASERPFFGNSKVAIIEIFSLTLESANALLKIFEEPGQGTHFFVISPSAEAVMPTLRSRLTIINNFSKNGEIGEETIEFCEKFMNLAPHKRLESMKKVLLDKIKTVDFLNGLEVILEKAIKTSAPPRIIKALEEVQNGRQFIFDRASSSKMIMEHLALALPRL